MPALRHLERRAGFKPRPELSHIVFDFDGTLSWLRHGWPEIMCRLFLELLPPEHQTTQTHEQLLNDVLSLNGKASIHQMSLGAERIRQLGGSPPSPENLLAEYLRRLDTALAERSRSIQTGQAEPDAFLVYGSRTLLQKLHALGKKLFILSGTQQHRVREEAALLKIDAFFGGHIYGGTADLAQSDKRAVIQRLLAEEQIPGERLLCVGDGPVELHIAREVGGVALGVASDEDQNGSGRLHPQKLSQLRNAGADVLIPDYGDPDAVLEAILG